MKLTVNARMFPFPQRYDSVSCRGTDYEGRAVGRREG